MHRLEFVFFVCKLRIFCQSASIFHLQASCVVLHYRHLYASSGACNPKLVLLLDPSFCCSGTSNSLHNNYSNYHFAVWLGQLQYAQGNFTEITNKNIQADTAMKDKHFEKNNSISLTETNNAGLQPTTKFLSPQFMLSLLFQGIRLLEIRSTRPSLPSRPISIAMYFSSNLHTL